MVKKYSQFVGNNSHQNNTRMSISSNDMAHAKALLNTKQAFIIDCDGVMYAGSHLLPGAKEFIDFLQRTNKSFLFLTNSSDKTAKDLVDKFKLMGLDILENQVYTSSMATASFIASQHPFARVYCIGHPALKLALEAEGLNIVDEYDAEISRPDFVVLGETCDSKLYNYDIIEFAVKLVRRGSRLIGTNEDTCDRVGSELLPGTGSLILPIAVTSGYEPYFVGKPNPIMVSSAINILKTDTIGTKETIFIGDRMNTDIRAGVEANCDTILVMSGVTSESDIQKYAYRPSIILNGVGDIIGLYPKQSKM